MEIHYTKSGSSLGSILVKRYGVRASGRQDLRFEKSYKLSELSLSSLYEMLGLGGAFGNKIKSAISDSLKSGNNSATMLSSSIGNLTQISNGIKTEIDKSMLPKQIKSISASVVMSNNKISGITARIELKKDIAVATLTLKRK